MRQGFKPLADFRANRGFWPPAHHLRNRVFTIFTDRNEESQKNPVSGHLTHLNHDKINSSVIHNSPQWTKPAPKLICN